MASRKEIEDAFDEAFEWVDDGPRQMCPSDVALEKAEKLFSSKGQGRARTAFQTICLGRAYARRGPK